MSFEKIKKENLTDDLIKQDIICKFKNGNHIVPNIVLISTSVFFAFLFSFFSPFAWLVVLIPVSLMLIWYIRRRIKIKEIKKGEFTVVRDEFLYEKQGELRKEATFYKGKYISYIEFATNGRWELDGSYYTWSDKYKMSGAGICNTSTAKDTFYVVLYNSNHKIAIAYNTKFFDYQNIGA